MIRGDLPENVSIFIENYIDSVEQLQVLLLLHSLPERVWSNSEITFELRSTHASIAKRLENLYLKKVLISPKAQDRHQFIPRNEEMRMVIEDLAEQNKLKPNRVIDAIYSRRDYSIKAFADAFKVRGNKT